MTPTNPAIRESGMAQTTPSGTESREALALKVTRRYALWSMGGGLIPLVGLDIVAILGVQLKMLHAMSGVYCVEFREHRAKSIVASLVGSLGIIPIGTGIFYSIIKVIPFVGSLAATVALPISAGAITWATGKVFIAHFESGGTFLDLNPEKMKQAYRKMFEEGKQVMAAERKQPA